MSDEEEPLSQSECLIDTKGIPRLYGVYLLNSISKKSSFYVGSTPNPVRRLRQHNGELSAGGAYRTKKKGFRPWKMVLYVYGFPSKVSALQFEHAWQHSFKTRYISEKLNPGQKGSGSGYNVHSKLANLRLLLKSNGFNRLGLQICVFSTEILEKFNMNKFKILNGKEIVIDDRRNTEFLGESSIIPGGNYEQLKLFMNSLELQQEEHFKRCDETLEEISHECLLCSNAINVTNDINTLTLCYLCGGKFHLLCLSQCFLQNEDNHILPVSGPCIGCGEKLWWREVVRGTDHIIRKLHMS